MATDEVTSVPIPTSGNGDDSTVKIETETPDDAAPWGYKEDGTPYKVNPERYRKRAANQRRATAPTAKGKAKKTSDHREAVLGAIQIVSLPIAAAATRSDVFAADLVAINVCAEPIADAFDSLAGQNKAVAMALDKLGEVGPYGLVFAAVAPLLLQIGVNHGLVPAGTAGTVPPEVLLAEVAGDAQTDTQGAMAAA